jgi:tetratricopeptide (TPR) repeat protein
VTVDVDEEVAGSFEKINVGAHTSISFHRTLRVPEDGRVYPLPADLGSFPIYRIEDYANKVPPHWLKDGGFFIPLYQREALFLAFEGAAWRPTTAKVAVGRINAITGKPYDERIRQHEQDYVIIPEQRWLDGINTGKNLVSQFVAMPIGEGFTIEEQMTDEARHGGFQIVVFEPKLGRFPEEAPAATQTRAKATEIRRLRPQLDKLINILQPPYPAIGINYLNGNHRLVDHAGKTLSINEHIHLLKDLRVFLQEKLQSAAIAGWSDEEIAKYSKVLSKENFLSSAPVSLGLPAPLSAARKTEYIEMGIARGGSIKQQIFRDHYGVESWDESAKRALTIRIVNSVVFQKITGFPAPASPISAETYQRCGIPWYDQYDEAAESIAPAKKFSLVKSIAAITKLRGEKVQSVDAPFVVTPEIIRRIHTPTRKERIASFLSRAEASWNAGRYAIAHREATLAMSLLVKAKWYDVESDEKQRVLLLRASCNNKLQRYLEAEADATDLLRDGGKASGPLSIRAFSYLRLADYELAIQDASAALHTDPACLMAHEVLAEALLWSNATDGAFAGAEHALRLDPGSSPALIVRGECWRRMGYPLHAVTDLSRALERGPDAVAYATRAETFVVLGRIADAKSDLEAALSLEPNYDFARDLLARISS